MKTSLIYSVALIHIKNRKLLQVLVYHKNAYYMPGGKKEKGEDDIQAIVREVKEELSVDLIPLSIKYYGVFEAQAYGKPQGVYVQMTCYTGDFKGEPKEGNEIKKVDYFNYKEYYAMPETAPVVRLVYDELKKKNLLD